MTFANRSRPSETHKCSSRPSVPPQAIPSVYQSPRCSAHTRVRPARGHRRHRPARDRHPLPETSLGNPRTAFETRRSRRDSPAHRSHGARTREARPVSLGPAAREASNGRLDDREAWRTGQAGDTPRILPVRRCSAPRSRPATPRSRESRARRDRPRFRGPHRRSPPTCRSCARSAFRRSCPRLVGAPTAPPRDGRRRTAPPSGVPAAPGSE